MLFLLESNKQNQKQLSIPDKAASEILPIYKYCFAHCKKNVLLTFYLYLFC